MGFRFKVGSRLEITHLWLAGRACRNGKENGNWHLIWFRVWGYLGLGFGVIRV